MIPSVFSVLIFIPPGMPLSYVSVKFTICQMLHASITAIWSTLLYVLSHPQLTEPRAFHGSSSATLSPQCRPSPCRYLYALADMPHLLAPQSWYASYIVSCPYRFRLGMSVVIASSLAGLGLVRGLLAPTTTSS